MSKNTSTSVVAKAPISSLASTESTPRTAKQQADLKKLEKQIEDNYQSSFLLAAALAQIREQKLYRPEYNSFEAYCKARWDYSRSYCLRLCDVNGVMTDLNEIKDARVLPQNEAQARIFVDLAKNERLALAEKVREEKVRAVSASVFAKFKKAMFPDKCVSKASTNQTPMENSDANSAVKTPALPSVVKILDMAKALLQTFEDNDSGDEPIADKIREFLKCAEPLAQWERQQKVKQN